MYGGRELMMYLEEYVKAQVTKHSERAPYQKNTIDEADAELISCALGKRQLLAVTMDSIVEEIECGLYSDPYLIGWVTAMSSLSDLAAVGAEPIGFLLSLGGGDQMDPSFVERLIVGVTSACQKSGTFLLGGDTSHSSAASTCGCAFGVVPEALAMTRVGAGAGEAIYLTGPAGLGNMYALSCFSGDETIPCNGHLARARLSEGTFIRDFASCCVDTSDGLLLALDTLAEENRCRIEVDACWSRFVHPLVLETSRLTGIPAWLFLAGIHGEFELCFCVPPHLDEDLKKAANRARIPLFRVGRTTQGSGVSVRTMHELLPIDTPKLRELSAAAGHNPSHYIQELLSMGRRTRL
jgi:thiamine-monophosphate kinase